MACLLRGLAVAQQGTICKLFFRVFFVASAVVLQQEKEAGLSHLGKEGLRYYEAHGESTTDGSDVDRFNPFDQIAYTIGWNPASSSGRRGGVVLHARLIA